MHGNSTAVVLNLRRISWGWMPERQGVEDRQYFSPWQGGLKEWEYGGRVWLVVSREERGS